MKYRQGGIFFWLTIFCSSREIQTQEEFIHTLQHALRIGKQIVLTSEPAADGNAAVRNRLKARLMGLSCRHPSRRTKKPSPIVKNKAQRIGIGCLNKISPYNRREHNHKYPQFEGTDKKIIGLQKPLNNNENDMDFSSDTRTSTGARENIPRTGTLTTQAITLLSI
jgi:chromosomal replication initiation ATPase DnaA